MKNSCMVRPVCTGLAVFLLYLPGTALSGQTADSNLAQLIQKAICNNPQIKAARDRWLAARDQIPQARSLPDPKIHLGYMNMSRSEEMDFGPQHERMIGGSQEIPFPAKLFVRGNISSLNERQMKAEYHATRLTIIAQLKRLYFDLFFIKKSIEIYRKNQMLLEKIAKSTEVNYSVGQTPQQDIYRAQTELSRIQMRLVMLDQEKQSFEANINRLLNRPLAIRIDTTPALSVTPLKFDFTYFKCLLEKKAPILQAQIKKTEKGKQTIRLSKLNYLPDVEIEGGRLHDTAMHMRGYQVMLKASLPLYFASKQNYEVRESLARYSADIEDLHSTHRDLLFQVKNALLLVQRSKQLIRLIQDAIIPQASLTFSSSQASYGVGKVDFLTLLNNLLTLQDNELELYSEMVQHEKAITQLEEITGVIL